MKNFIVCLFAAGLTFTLGLGAYLYSPTGKAEREVLQFISELHTAEINKDEFKLRQMLADDLTNSYNGKKWLEKEQLILNINQVEIESINTWNIFTHVDSEKVSVSYKMEERFYFEGKLIVHRSSYIDTFKKQQRQWKLVEIEMKN